MPRRAISPEEIQSAVLTAATSLFLEKGIYQTEMKEIAQKAGVSLSSLYRHASDKNQIAFRVVATLMKELTSPSLSFSERIEGESGIERLRRTLYLMLDGLQQHSDYLSIFNEFDTIYRGAYPDIKEAKEYVLLMQRLANKALQFVLEAIADGSMLHVEDPQLFSATVQNTVFGLALRFFPREEHFKEEHHSPGRLMIEEAIELMLNAVRQ